MRGIRLTNRDTFLDVVPEGVDVSGSLPRFSRDLLPLRRETNPFARCVVRERPSVCPSGPSLQPR